MTKNKMKNQLKAAVLTIGDELLIGQVLNSNVRWVSEKLTEIGYSVVHQLTVGDDRDQIKQALDFLLPQSDAIIIGGGLGPTHDDITMEVLADYTDMPLEYDAEWISRVENFFKSRGRVMSENNKKQGYLLKGAHRIDNDCGTAAGQHFQINQTDLFVVPGVPHEVKSMVDRYILPVLTQKAVPLGIRILKKTLLTTGLGESALALQCDPFVQKIKTMPELSLAFLPSSTKVRLRLQMNAQSDGDQKQFDSLVEELKTYCGKEFYGFDEVTLEQLLIQELQKRNETLALAESCTGGYLSHQITNVSGSSKVLKGSLVCYQPEIKTRDLGITLELMKQKGVVSEDVAKALAENVRQKWGSTYGLGVTGFLGTEGGDAFAKSGTVWIALATPKETVAKSFQMEADRQRGKERTARAACDLLRRWISH